MAQNEVVPSQIMPPGPGERMLGVIPEVYKWTWYGLKQWFSVIVTDKRLVFAREIDLNSRPEKYAGMKIEEVLSENKGNFAVTKEELKSFAFASGMEETGTCGRVHYINGELKFETAKSKSMFYVPTNQTGLARKLFKETGLKLVEMEKPIMA
jgi:hypothetical protein